MLFRSDFLRAHVRQTQGLDERLRQLQAHPPHGEQRCELLDADGRCAVYAARPIVCRSHGAPLRLPDGQLDACPLNFEGEDLARLGDCIDVQTLDTLRFVVARRYDPHDDGRRYPLTIDELLSP